MRTIEISETKPGESSVASSASRISVMIYSLLAYTVGMAGLFWLILASGGLVPYGFGPIEPGSLLIGILINSGLIFLFGLQHTVMARQGFKQKMKAIFPEPVERATFTLASGIMMAFIVWNWQALPGTVWLVENEMARAIMWTMYAAGWGYLVLATFVTNHFELFGLRQAWLYFRGVPYTSIPFVRKWMYTYSRHPMMLGILFGLWFIPEMSVTHFALSLLLTLYIVAGVHFEEKDLLDQFGESYREYKQEVGALFTFK